MFVSLSLPAGSPGSPTALGIGCNVRAEPGGFAGTGGVFEATAPARAAAGAILNPDEKDGARLDQGNPDESAPGWSGAREARRKPGDPPRSESAPG